MYLKAYYANGTSEIFDATMDGVVWYIRMNNPLMVVERFDHTVIYTKEEGFIK